MFGLQKDELAALVGVTYLALRALFALGRVIWWYVADVRRIVSMRPWVPLLTGVAVALMAVALLSIATGLPRRRPHHGLLAAAFVGFLLGIAVDFVIHIRLWRPRTGSRRCASRGTGSNCCMARVGGLGAARAIVPREILAPGPARVARGVQGESADVRAEAATAVLHAIPEPADDDAEVPKAARAL